MLTLGLNHMTMARASTEQLLDTAQALGCVGVELRNDLAAGFNGPLSHEAFAPRVHALQNPTHALSVANDFITSELAKQAA